MTNQLRCQTRQPVEKPATPHAANRPGTVGVGVACLGRHLTCSLTSLILSQTGLGNCGNAAVAALGCPRALLPVHRLPDRRRLPPSCRTGYSGPQHRHRWPGGDGGGDTVPSHKTPSLQPTPLVTVLPAQPVFLAGSDHRCDCPTPCCGWRAFHRAHPHYSQNIAAVSLIETFIQPLSEVKNIKKLCVVFVGSLMFLFTQLVILCSKMHQVNFKFFRTPSSQSKNANLLEVLFQKK